MGNSSWRKCKISDIGTVVGGATPSTKCNSFWDGDIPWITPKDLSGYNYRYIKAGSRNITVEGFNSCSTKMLPKGTVLFSSRAPIGYVAIAENDLCTNQGFKSVIPNKDTDYKFLYYLLRYNAKNIERLVGGGSSTFNEVSGSAMKNIDVFVPDMLTQCKIALVLSTIDDKIELNNLINKNLEEQAKNIFVNKIARFDNTPIGWKKEPLDKIASYLNGLAMQKFPPYVGELSIPVLKITELKQGYCDSNSDYCNVRFKPQYVVNDGDVIFSWSASLVVDFWCGGKVGLNQHLFKVTSEKYGKWFYYSWTKYYLNSFINEASAKATTMGHITRDRLAKAITLIPDKKTYDEVGLILEQIYSEIINKRKENKYLVELRDTLLPKLMSGEIDITTIDLLG